MTAPQESLYAAMARWTTGASPRRLTAMVVLGLVGTLAVLLFATASGLLFAGYPIALGAVGGWGLLAQWPDPLPGWVRPVRGVLVVVGTMAGLSAVIATMFWAMGPAPIL